MPKPGALSTPMNSTDMPQATPPCKCPHCRKGISLEHLKANLAEDALKTLWASFGARSRKGRKISPANQAAMQAARAKRKADAEAARIASEEAHADAPAVEGGAK